MADLISETNGGSLGEVLAQSWPTSLTMFSATLTRFVDGLMVARIGPVQGPRALTAQTYAGILAFVPEALVIGALTVVNTYVSQNLGAGRRVRCAQYGWAGVVIGLLAAAMIAPLALVAGPLFSLFTTHGARIIALETMYFRYMVICTFASLPTAALNQFFFGIHRPRVTLAAALVANAFNVAGNYVLIFGKFGLPALGLEGAAVATLLSWVLQVAILLAVYLRPRLHQRYRTRWLRLVTGASLRDILRIGWPSGVQFCNDVLSWSVFVTALVGSFGEVHMAATAVAMKYMPLSFMPVVGLGIATTAVVGKLIGQGRRRLARRRARTALLIAMIYMGACGLAFWAFREPLMRFFVSVPHQAELSRTEARQLADQIVRIGGTVLICAAVFQLFDAVGIVYVGALRGAGDTRWPMVVTIVLSWGVIIGAGSAMVRFAAHLGSLGPWLAASAYVILLGFLMAWRFESGAWEKINLLRRRPSPVAVGEPTPALPELLAGEMPGKPAPEAEETAH